MKKFFEEPAVEVTVIMDVISTDDDNTVEGTGSNNSSDVL